MKLLIILFLLAIIFVSGCAKNQEPAQTTPNISATQLETNTDTNQKTNITKYTKIDNSYGYFFETVGLTFSINESWSPREMDGGLFLSLVGNPNVSIHVRNLRDFAGKSKNDIVTAFEEGENGNASKIISKTPVIIGIGNLGNIQSLEIVAEFFGYNETAMAKTTIIGDNTPIVIDYQVIGKDAESVGSIYKTYEEDAKKIIWSISFPESITNAK